MVGTRLLAVMLLVLGSAAPLFAQDTIRWGSDLNQAAQQARQQGKLLLIHFYNDGCPPCERLEKNVFSQAAVATAIDRGYVAVKVHAGKSPKVAESFQVDRWPVDVIATCDGEELFRTVSPQAVNTYVNMLDEVSKKAAPMAASAANPVATPAPAVPASQPRGPAGNVEQTGGYIVNQYAPAAATNPAEIVNRYTNTAANAGRQMQAQAGQSVQAMQGAAVASTQRGMDQFNQAGAAAVQTAQQKASAGMAYGQQMVSQGVAAAEQSANQAVSKGEQYAAQGIAGASQYAQQAQQQASAYGERAANQISQYMPVGAPAAPQGQTSVYGGGQAPAPQQAPPSQDQAWNPAEESAPPATAAPAYGGVYGQAPSHAPTPQVGGAGHSGLPDITAPVNPQPAGMKFVAAAQAPAFGLEKHCPVTLAETMKWTKGNPQFGAVHRGRTYLFASQQAQQKFLADPDRFSPVLSGCDPVVFAEQGKLAEGKRNCGSAYRGQMFFFVDAASRERFEKSPDVYAVPAYQAMMQADTRLR